MLIPDVDLHIISGFSSSLSHLNLKGCSSVTDMGISQLVSNCMNLCSLLVSDTDFGRNSVLALCSDVPLPAHLLGLHHHHMHLSTLAFQLQQLHICGCKSEWIQLYTHLSRGTSIILFHVYLWFPLYLFIYILSRCYSSLSFASYESYIFIKESKPQGNFPSWWCSLCFHGFFFGVCWCFWDDGPFTFIFY